MVPFFFHLSPSLLNHPKTLCFALKLLKIQIYLKDSDYNHLNLFPCHTTSICFLTIPLHLETTLCSKIHFETLCCLIVMANISSQLLLHAVFTVHVCLVI